MHLLLLAMLLFTVSTPDADVIHVPAQAPDLAAAIPLAAPGDTIQLAHGLYEMDTAVLQFPLTILGDIDEPQAVILDGGASDRLFRVYGPGVFHLKGLWLRNGMATTVPHLREGGALRAGADADLRMSHCRISGSSAQMGGGGLAVLSARCRLEDCLLDGNTESALLLDNSDAVLFRCRFLGNRGARGGAIQAHLSDLYADDCHFQENRADEMAGVFHFQFGVAQWFHSTFVYNEAPAGGVGVGRLHNFYRCTFFGNVSPWGSLLTDPDRITFYSCQIVSHLGSHWSGCNSPDDEITLDHTNVWNNPGGDYSQCVSNQSGENGNMSVDPLFCDPAAGVFELHTDSPCLPAQSGLLDPIGAAAAGSCQEAGLLALYAVLQDTVLLGEALNFYSASLPATVTHEWDFDGDGLNDSVERDPVWSCNLPGWQSVRLIVRDGERADTTQIDSLVYVRPPETWDVPWDFLEIAEALAWSREGDTVLVDCGIWQVNDLQVPSGVTLRGDPDDPDCVVLSGGGLGRIFDCSWSAAGTVIEGFRIRDGEAVGPGIGSFGGAVRLNASPVTFRRCVFSDNLAADGGVVLLDQQAPRFEDCTFAGNHALNSASVVYVSGSAGRPVFERCILSGNEGEGAIVGAAELFCTDIHGNAGGDWTANIAEQQGQNGNLNLEPAFCDPAAGDYRLADESALWSQACGVPGAYRRDCEGVDTKPAPERPQAFILHCFPNPFNPTLTIEWTAPGRTAELRLYDLQGRLVRRTVPDAGPAGTWRATIDAGGLAGGLYIVEARAGKRRARSKVLLLK